MSTLEDRYRRLLAVYPAAYRRRYAAEMLTTLMDGADERQRSPRWRESIDLVWNAFLLRLFRNGSQRTSDPRWVSASGVFGTLGALTLSALLVLKPAGNLGWHQQIGEAFPTADSVQWQALALAGAWLVVAALAIAGWRRAAAISAWLAAISFAAWQLTSHRYLDLMVAQWPLIVLAVTIAACLTFSHAPQSIRQMLGGRLVVFFGAAAVAGSSLWLDSRLGELQQQPVVIERLRDWPANPNGTDTTTGGRLYSPGIVWSESYPVPSNPLNAASAAPLLIFVAFAAVAILVLLKMGGPIRRRVLALAAAPLTTWGVASNLYSMSYGNWPKAATLTVFSLVLLLLPPLTFAIGMIMVRRNDNREHLIDLGRAHLHAAKPVDTQ